MCLNFFVVVVVSYLWLTCCAILFTKCVPEVEITCIKLVIANCVCLQYWGKVWVMSCQTMMPVLAIAFAPRHLNTCSGFFFFFTYFYVFITRCVILIFAHSNYENNIHIIMVQNTQEIKRRLFNKMKQDKTCKFSM